MVEPRLTKYEAQREPHAVQENVGTVAIPWADMLEQMKCPVCLNLIEEAWATEVRVKQTAR